MIVNLKLWDWDWDWVWVWACRSGTALDELC
jgi:hypothetical protein